MKQFFIMSRATFQKLPKLFYVCAICLLGQSRTAQAQTLCAPIYVSPSGTALAFGTMLDPTDLATALQRASSNNGAYIKLAAGTYNLDSTLTIPSNTTLEGGFNSNNAWRKTSLAGATTLHRTTQNPHGVSPAQRLVGFQAVGASNFRFQDLTITTANANLAGMSVYGVYLSNCSNYKLVRTQILAGNAAAGANGLAGINGMTGTSGSAGSPGQMDALVNVMGGNGGNGGSSGGIATGGIGGASGAGTTGNTAAPFSRAGGGGGGGGAGGQAASGGSGGLGGGAGQAGSPGFTSTTSPGGAGGGAASVGIAGTSGVSGSNGTVGSAGTMGSAPSLLAGSFFQVGGQGGTGTNGAGGRGGSGGGGGGGQNCPTCTNGTGNGGGAGGGGGEGGSGGTGGFGGGGSFGLYLANNGANTYLIDCHIVAGTAGAGGLGGNGGNGGTGGTGGMGSSTGTTEVGRGGNGGTGGTGGNGGRGGDGQAGIAQAVVLNAGTALVSNDTAFNLVGQPEIFADNNNCANVSMNLAATATPSAWDFDLMGNLATPNTASGSPVAVQFNAVQYYSLQATISSAVHQYTDFVYITNYGASQAAISTTATALGSDTFQVCIGQTASFSSVYGADTFAWDFGSLLANPGNVQEVQNVSFSNLGIFPITLQTNNLCCNPTPHLDTIYISVCNTTTIQKTNAASNYFSVLPNPSQGQFDVQFNLPLSQEGYLRVVDALGQTLAQRLIGATPTSFSFDLSQQPAGMYIVLLQLGTQQFSQKISISH